MQPVTWPLFSSLLEFLFCILWFISFNTPAFSHFSHRKSWSGSAEIWRTVFCGFELFLLYGVTFLTILSWTHKAILSTWTLAFLRAPVSFGGNEPSECWTHIPPGAPRAACAEWCLWPYDVKWHLSGDWLRARVGLWRIFVLNPFLSLFCALPELREDFCHSNCHPPLNVITLWEPRILGFKKPQEIPELSFRGLFPKVNSIAHGSVTCSLVEWSCCCCISYTVVSDSLRLHGILQASTLELDSLLQGIFPTQGPNLGIWHCRWILYSLSHQGRS